MNEMKKWVVAGIVGLFSTGMAWASIDLNQYAWAPDGAVDITVTPPGSETPRNSDNGNGTLTYNAYAATPTRHGEIAINGSAITFHYDKAAYSTTSGRMDLWSDYTVNVPGADYTGITFDFQDPSAVTYGYYYLRVYYHDSLGDHNAEYNLKTHSDGLVTVAWTDSNWNIDSWTETDELPAWGNMGSIAGLDTIYTVSVRYSYLSTVGTKDVFSFTDKINSITLDGVQGVPEPETVWMIVAVLASLAVTFRRQLLDLAGRFVKA